MEWLKVVLPCGKHLCFVVREDQKAYCNNPRVQNLLVDHGVVHLDGTRYFPEDGKIFLEALHDFYWLKGFSVETV